jgi:hypothetical protein
MRFVDGERAGRAAAFHFRAKVDDPSHAGATLARRTNATARCRNGNADVSSPF